MNRKDGMETFEDVKIIFPNFSGKETRFNQAGNRNFSIIIDDPARAQALKDIGWNVHERQSNDPDGSVFYTLSVKVCYKKIKPNVVMVNSKGKLRLDEDTIDRLDWVRFDKVDVTVRPYHYPETPQRPAGISAYLHTLYATVEEDDLDLKYADIPFLN